MTRDISSFLTPARTATVVVLALSSISAVAQVVDPAVPPVASAPVATSSPAIPASAAPAPNATRLEDFKLKPPEPVVKSLPELNSLPVEPVVATNAAGEKAEKRSASAPPTRTASAKTAIAEKATREVPVERGVIPASDAKVDIVGPAVAPASVPSIAEEGAAEAVPAPAASENPASRAEPSVAGGNAANVWLGGGAALLLLGGGAAFLLSRRRKEEQGEGELLLAEDRVIPDASRISDALRKAGGSLPHAGEAFAPVAQSPRERPVAPQPASLAVAPAAFDDVEAVVSEAPLQQNPFLGGMNRQVRDDSLMTHSYPATGRLDDRPPLRVRPGRDGEEERGVQLYYDYGRREQPSLRFKPQLRRP